MEKSRLTGLIKRTEVVALALCFAAGVSLYFSGTVLAQSAGMMDDVQTYLDQSVANTSPSFTQGACGTGSILIQWPTIQGADGYRIARDGDGQIYAGASPTFTDTGLAAGSTHTYYFGAYKGSTNSNNNPSYRVLAPAACVQAAPNPPTNVSASFSSFASGVVLNWTQNNSYVGFKILRRVAQLGNAFAEIQSITSSTQTTYTDSSGLNPGTTYEYEIIACSNGGCSGPSAVATATIPNSTTQATTPTTTTTTTTTTQPPSAATGLAAQFNLNAGGIVLTWVNAGSVTPTAIVIARRAAGGTYTQIQTLSGSQNTYTDSSSLSPATTYEYQLASCNGPGNCTGSANTATATTPSSTTGTSSSATNGVTNTSQVLETFIGTSGHGPAQPGLSVSSPSGCGTFTLYLSWAAVSGATSYDIYRDNAFVINTKNTAYADTGLPPSTSHEYRVVAKNSYGSADSQKMQSTVPPACAVVATTSATAPQPVAPVQPQTPVTSVPLRNEPTPAAEQPKTVLPTKVSVPVPAATPAAVPNTPASAAPIDTVPVALAPVSPETATSLQAASQSIAAVQTAINDAVTDLIAQIDAHVQTINGGGNPEVAKIRESLIASIKAAISGIPTQQDIANLQPLLNDGFARMDAAVGVNNAPVSVSVEALSQVAQNANQSLQASGAIDMYKDSNDDGISDYDSVHVYHIDPLARASATPSAGISGGSTLTAGEKILQGYDPTAKGLVKVTYEEPAVSQAPQADVYKVEQVALTGEKKVQLAGTALPNSYVTLYIYSTPVIVTVKADSDGRWQYTVDRELESGKHTVYAATVDNSGRILAKSVAIPFTKTAEAATLDTVAPIVSAQGSEPGLLNNPAIVPLILLSALFIFGVLYVIGKDFAGKNGAPPVA